VHRGPIGPIGAVSSPGASLNGRGKPKVTYPEAKLTPGQRAARQTIYEFKVLANELARRTGIQIADVSDLLMRAVICETLMHLSRRDPAALGALRGTVFTDAKGDWLHLAGMRAGARDATVSLDSKALNELPMAHRVRIVAHELAHLLLKHDAQSRPRAEKEIEAWRQVAAWGF
jgi:hypothetical protein